MKLSELKPCDVCGGPLGMLFYRVTAEQMMIDASAANQVLGLSTMFGGRLGLAEVMAPAADVTMDLQTNTSMICDKCAYEISLVRVLLGVGGKAGE